MQTIFAAGLCSRRTPKIVGKKPAGPATVGGMSNLLVSQSLEVTPCCSGPAPMIIDAQFGLLEVGMTPRAWRVKEPSRISRCRTGVLVAVKPTEPNPSQPI